MGTTTEKLNYLNETKSQIKSALNDLGAEITNDTTFRDYVDKINEIAEEYPTQEQISNLQTIQPQNIQPLNLQMHNETENIVQSIEEIDNESTINVQNEEVE